MADQSPTSNGTNGLPTSNKTGKKLHGRDFYKSIGSPKMILAPMVEQSEFAWRMLSRSYMTPETNSDLLAYTPMFHARMFTDTQKYRDGHFQPIHGPIPSPPDAYHTSQYSDQDQYLDGNTKIDRPLFVQFCANKPDELLAAAQHVQAFCDAVDLNLGCPQGIAKRGNYGSFLQEEPDTIYNLIHTLHTHLDIPITAKMRILDTKEKTLNYANMILSAGASILTVHGRQRHQKGHNTGLADWKMIRYLRDNLPPETVLFANGNILRHEDIAACLEATGADGVMSAEGNLYDPTIFGKPPPVGQEGREYWRGRDGKGGYRMDGVLRRYMDIIHRHVLGQEPPTRQPLFLPSDLPPPQHTSPPPPPPPPQAEEPMAETPSLKRSVDTITSSPVSAPAITTTTTTTTTNPPASKKQKQQKAEKRKASKGQPCTSPNLVSMQAHLFHLLRPLVSTHTHIRDALARCRSGDIPAFEHVLALVEDAVKEGLLEYSASPELFENTTPEPKRAEDGSVVEMEESSLATVAMCKRPWWVCQPYVRPLPKEALEKGSLQLSKKEKARLEREKEKAQETDEKVTGEEAKVMEVALEGRVEVERDGADGDKVEVAKEGLVCG